MEKLKHIFGTLCTLVRHSPFILYNFIVPAWGTLGLVTSSGLKLRLKRFLKGDYNDVDRALFWSYFLPVIVAIEFVCLLFKTYYLQRNKNWWNLSLIIEKVKESKFFKTSVSLMGIGILISQHLAYITCPDYQGDCIMNFYPQSHTPISSDQYTKLTNFMIENMCTDYELPYDSMIPKNLTNQTITLDMYLNLQQKCYNLMEKCKPVCSDQSTLINFIYSAITGIIALYLFQFYDGPHHDGIPHHLKVFDKLKIPKYKFKCLSLSKFWSSPSELIQLLLPMLFIQQSCKEDYEEFEHLKEKYSDLPWDWVRGFNKKDFEELKVILPHEQKTMSPVWEITGPINKLYKPLKHLREIKQLEGNDLFYSLQIIFLIFVEPPMEKTDQEDQSVTVSVVCSENTFGYNIVQFELSEIQKLMGFEHEDCFGIKFKKKTFTKLIEKKHLIGFDDRSIMKFFPIFMQKIQGERAIKQEGEIQVILTSKTKNKI